LELLREGHDFALYRGSARDGRAVLGVAVAERASSPRPDRLEHEYSLAGELDPQWAARPIALSRLRDRMVLILQDPGGEPLDRLIDQQRGQPIDLARFLRIAIGLAGALGHTHRRGLIHKDIKPANALVNDAGRVWLTGFGMATRLPRDRSSAKAPELLDGTLAYMAPEQTGRIDRFIDCRSDLYSLGVTLYELLLGALPFTASEPMEWVHCQIARVPLAPRERVAHIPEPVSNIIMKLLAKTAEERFQTAVGVERDLHRCLLEWEAHGRVDEFALGQYDQSNRLRIPDKLYGRTAQINLLRASFDRVMASGESELVLIAGRAGVGKSTIVDGLQRSLNVPGSLFAVGKFEQRQTGIPHATIARAFQNLIRQILSRSDAELQSWRKVLGAALGANGLLIVKLIPELELIIGKQPPVAELSPQDAQRRFRAVLRAFIGTFARRARPLALFLDDLQWIDLETLDFLEDLLNAAEMGPLLLIGAYRDNEVDAGHPLLSKLEAIRRTLTVRDILLSSLSIGELELLVGDALQCDPKSAHPLVRLVREKTGGNPFFAIQFLRALHEESLLYFNHTYSQWCWDLPRIHAKGYSDNVADLMVANIERLPAQTSTVLRRLACIGSAAKFTLLSTLCQISVAELHEFLLEAVRAGLVLRAQDSYLFGHDRIQEAAYTLIVADTRAELHLQLGRLLLAGMSEEAGDEMLFEILSQFNRALPLISNDGERRRVAQLNLSAGKRAMEAAAYASALTYFAAARSLLGDCGWTRQYSLSFEVELHIAECELLNGNLSNAEDRLAHLTRRAAGPVDRAATTCLQIDLYVVCARPERAVAIGLEFLRGVGVLLPTHPTDEEVRGVFGRIWLRLENRRIEDLINLPTMEDPDGRATMDVLNKLVLSALYLRPKLHQLLIAHMVEHSMQYGNSPASCMGYVSLARVLVNEFEDYARAVRFGQLSLELLEKPGLNAYAARVYFSFGTGISPWTEHLRRGLPFLSRALDEARKIGDLPYVGYCHSNIVGNLLSSGAPLAKVDRAAMEGLEFACNTGSRIAAAFIVGQLRLIRSLRGLPCDFRGIDGEEFNADRFERSLRAGSSVALTAEAYRWRRMQAFVIEGDFVAALEIAAAPATATQFPTPNIEAAEYHFYAALARARSLQDTPAGTSAWTENLDALRAHQQRLHAWAEHCPENFESRAALVSAELARVQGAVSEAECLYTFAVRSARTTGFIQTEALACETASRFYAARGLEDIAEMYLGRARDCYARWGADGKVRQLEAAHAWLCHTSSRYQDQTYLVPHQPLDVAAVVKASQTLSSEMLLPRLIERLMRIAVENAGADRGALILIRGGEPRIEAEAFVRSGNIEVRHGPPSPAELPQSVLHYAVRTQERVLLDDASSDIIYSKDEYVQSRHSRSVLCLPILRQTKLVGALYLENNLTPGAFTPDRLIVLELLAAQAAISLENSALYTDLQRSEAFMAQGQSVGHTGSFGWNVASGDFYWSEELYSILEYDRSVQASMDLAVERIHPDDRDDVRQLLDSAMREGRQFNGTHRLFMADGRIKHVHISGRAMNTGNLDFVGSVSDVTERVRAEQQLRQVQNDLAHVARVGTLNAMTASITHEVSQPLVGILTNASTCISMLEMDPPDLIGAAATVRRTIRDANRASDVIARLRAMFSKTRPTMEMVDLNEAAREVFILSAGELQRRRAQLQTDLAEDLPLVRADRVQLQQVVLNLVLNAADAMAGVEDRPRAILVRTRCEDARGVRLDVQDSGVGVSPEANDKLFDAFYTTKQGGMGLGLSICRSIIESHHGRLWASANDGDGSTFSFYIPALLAESELAGKPMNAGPVPETSKART